MLAWDGLPLGSKAEGTMGGRRGTGKGKVCSSDVQMTGVAFALSFW